MGGGLSVCNNTGIAAHIAFSQIGPLYYQNSVVPGDCMTRNGIGNVHMTIEARAGLNGLEFSDTDVALPIVATTAGVLTAACTFGASTLIHAGVTSACAAVGISEFVAVGVGGSTAALVTYGSGVIAVTTGGISYTSAIQKASMKDAGHYTNCMRWDLRGGPPVHDVIDINGIRRKLADFSSNNIEFYLTNGHHYGC